MNKKISKIIYNLPQKTGIYVFKDKSGAVLYVGKAVSLKRRVGSYFNQKNKLEPSKIIMVGKIADIDYITTASEYEALLLESNLIKQYRPKYNILLKDDKNYIYIKIENINDYPKIYTTRKLDDKNSQYFGPFTDGLAAKNALKLLRKLFPYRDCSENIFGKKKECLKFHINQCLAPCIGAISKKEYNALIRNCELFLLGKRSKLVKDLDQKMKKYSENKNYEKAAEVRDQINTLNKIIDRQIVISTKKENQDYISLIRYREQAIINLFIVREGKIIGKENFILQALKDVNNIEILENFIYQHYLHALDIPREIIVQEKISSSKKIAEIISKKTNKQVVILSAQRGKKKEIIEMGIKNANEYLFKKIGPQISPETFLVLKNIKTKFNLAKIPKRIEAYDISNIQGKLAVGSMIVFTNGHPDKKEYRKFKIKTVTGANDVAMLEEVINRRLRNKHWPYPDLILVDGGKPQLNSIKKLLDQKKLSIPLMSLAKREEEVFTTRKIKPYLLPRDSEILKLLQRLRDEAHRFAITYHKNLRKKDLHK